jgi:2-methylisocitrate lyase-like PEP mutase family enzyme
MKMTTRLRQLLGGEEIIVAPGAYDGMTAKLVEHGGFPAAYMTGAGTAATLGYPDFGLVTMTEMVANATTLTRTVSIPVIADADTGYGNELNVTRTVREYEARGVAAIHIEDQVAPRRCGHLDGKEIIPTDAYLAKIRAAIAARRDQDFVIIARTDARAVAGFDEAIRRANAAIDGGADMAFVEASRSPASEGPCLLNVVRRGKTPDIDFAAARAMGYKLAILPSLLMTAAAEACISALRGVKETNAPPISVGSMPVSERFRRLGSDEWIALATKFRDPAAARAAE